MNTIRLLKVTEKQKCYVLEYFCSYDPLKAYVKACYVFSEEESKEEMKL